MRELVGIIRSGQAERRSLRDAAAESVAMRAAFGSHSARAKLAEEESEDDLGDPVAVAFQPRVPEFSSRARASLAKVPQRVARLALERAGALAGGSEGAWSNVKKLRDAGGPMSLRLGIHHRLLLTVSEDALSIEDVIAREDQDRWLSTWRRRQSS